MDRFQENDQKQLIGVCTLCGKAIYAASDLAETTPHITCKACKEKERWEEKRKRQVEEEKRSATREEARGKIRRTLLIPAVLAVIAAVALCVAYTEYALIAIPLILLLYITAVQILWDEAPVAPVFFFFLGAPKLTFGVICDLSMDGILFLLAVKLILWILGALLSVFCFFLGLALAMVFAPFAFPFKMYKAIRYPTEIEFLI